MGLAIGSNWGIELEAVHSVGIEKTNDSGFPMPVDFGGGIATGLGSVRVWPVSVETETQRTTWTPSVWLAHTLNEHVGLIFLAGAAFSRTVVEQEISFAGLTRSVGPLPRLFPDGTISPVVTLGPRNQETRATSYDVAPAVGGDVALCFGDHFRVVPGLRLNASGGSWALRSAVSVGWQF